MGHIPFSSGGVGGKNCLWVFDVTFTEKMASVACLPYCAVGMGGNWGFEGMLSVRVLGPKRHYKLLTLLLSLYE